MNNSNMCDNVARYLVVSETMYGMEFFSAVTIKSPMKGGFLYDLHYSNWLLRSCR